MTLYRRLLGFLRRRREEREMQQEMKLHLDLLTEHQKARGLDPAEARASAERHFGNLASHQEIARAQRAGVWLELLGRDLRHGVRSLVRSPGFATVAVVTLALGVGLNLAILSLGNAMFLRPLPGVRETASLYTLGRTRTGEGFGSTTYAAYRAYREGSAGKLRELAAVSPSRFNLSSGEISERVLGQYVSWNFFQTVGVRFAAGRAPLPHEDEPGGREPVAVISHRLWQTRWHGSPDVVGSSIVLNGVPVRVIGVTEEGFRALHLPSAYDLWVPLHLRTVLQHTDSRAFAEDGPPWIERLVARLEPGVSPEEAAAHLRGIALSLQPARVEGQPPPWHHRFVAYGPFPNPDMGGAYLFLGLLLVLSGLVLVAVGVNAASLLLSRALARSKEIAVRLALGASRGRVIRQILAEGLVLAALASLLGLLASNLAARWIVAQIPGENNDAAAIDLVVDWRLSLAAVGLTFLATLVVGLLPAWQGSQVGVGAALKSGETPARGRFALKSALVVAQVALCTVLLAVAGLMYRSQQALQRHDPTATLDGMLTGRLDVRRNGHNDARVTEFYAQFRERALQLPGVKHAGFAAITPFNDGQIGYGPVHGGAVAADAAFICAANLIDGDYFAALRLPLLRGREFTASDYADSTPVVIISQALAKRLWPDTDPVGQMLQFTKEGEQPKLVVGVVADDPTQRDLAPGAAIEPFYYRPLRQLPPGDTAFFVTSAQDPLRLLPSVRSVIREFDAHLPIFQPSTLAGLRDRTLWQQRIVSGLVLVCSALAVLLAMVGLYGALAQDVVRRTREIGVRIAVGATQRDVLGLVIRGGLRLTGLGVVVGVGAGLGLGRVLQSVLVGVSATDPLVFLGAFGAVLVLALIACWLPARRAMDVDPVVALRTE